MKYHQRVQSLLMIQPARTSHFDSTLRSKTLRIFFGQKGVSVLDWIRTQKTYDLIPHIIRPMILIDLTFWPLEVINIFWSKTIRFTCGIKGCQNGMGIPKKLLILFLTFSLNLCFNLFIILFLNLNYFPKRDKHFLANLCLIVICQQPFIFIIKQYAFFTPPPPPQCPFLPCTLKGSVREKWKGV